MRNLPVFWHEGMFLRPQHFQAAERYWSELNEVSQQIDHPYYYGLRGVSLSEEALANNQFQMNSCRARMKDGTLVNLEVGQEPDRLDMRAGMSGELLDSVELTDAFDREQRVRVFLAVPRLKMGRANVGRGSSDRDSRYLATTGSVQDETGGGNDEEVEFLSLNLRLLLSTQSHAGFEVLPIAQVKRAGSANSAPEIDPEYIPPLIAIEAWPRLSRDMIRVIYDRLGENINVLSEQVSGLDVALASDDPLDLRRVLLLSRLNEAYATLSSLTFSAGVHPFKAYVELCRAVGQLALFGATRKPPEFPRYDHDNLYPIFKWLKDQIEDLLGGIKGEDEPVRRFFTGSGPGMQVALEPQWLAEGWNWYVGVNRGKLTEEECRELLKPGSMNLDWKFGSASMVDFYKRAFNPGLRLEVPTQLPRNLPSGGPWLYYAVRRDNEAWPYVQKEQTLAMRLNTHLIRNLETLQGKRDLVVSIKGQSVILQFALFAVPPRR
ncbi:MAG: type VI secretion system baseplate subunit TssK [Pirellulaceae bacterium]